MRFRNAFGLGFLAITSVGYATSAPDAKTFIQSIQASYSIVSAGGSAPHPDNAVADVYADTDEGAFTMPYCPPGGASCDPGYLFFPYDKTAITQSKLADGSLQTVLAVDDGVTKKFTWTDKNGTVTFSNPQYMLDKKITVLEHVLTKVATQ